MQNEQNKVVNLMISQLKSYGFYSTAKQVAQATGIDSSCQPSNVLQDLCHSATKEELTQDEPKANEDKDCLIFDSSKKVKKVNPNYRSFFNTQHRGPARAAAFSLDGNFIATGSEDNSLKVLDAFVIQKESAGEERKVIKTLYDHTGPVNDVAFHPNGSVLASCSDDCNIKFFDLQKQNTKRGFRYLQDVYPIHSISFHPSGEYILSGTDHHAVRMFDIQSMKVYTPTSSSDHHLGPITQVRYASNGATFASCSVDGSIKLFDTVTSKCINTITKAHDGASVIGITFSKSCAYLLSTGLDSKGKLWDMSSGKVICEYIGATQKFDHAPMVFSYNEDYVIGTDCTSNSIVIWDSQTGMHTDAIHTIAPSPIDTGFISVGGDCRGRYWNIVH